MDPVLYPLNTLSGHTLIVRKDGLLSWNILWQENPVARVNFRSNQKQIIETSLGRYALRRKGIHVNGKLILEDSETGTELAQGGLFDRDMQLFIRVNSSDNTYNLRWLHHEGRWMIDVVDGHGSSIMRLTDTGTRMRWEARISLDFDKHQSTEVNLVLATLVSYLMRDRAERAWSLSFG